MQIKKINNNKLKVILNSNDLDEKNIDVDSFLSNSIESQNLFFEILDLAEEEYDFDIENNKAIVETISLDNNIFILTITKLKTDFSNLNENPSKVYCFESIEDIFEIYSFLHNSSISFKNCYIYELNQKYYLLLDTNHYLLEKILCEYASSIKNLDMLEDILIEYGNKIYI